MIEVAAERAAERFDASGMPMGEIGEGTILTLLFSRKASRRRMAGGELRLGTVAMYMHIYDIFPLSSHARLD
jgi:hypothetical protein